MAVTESLPGEELVVRGVADLAAGRITAEAALLARFRGRLGDCGVVLPAGAAIVDPELVMRRLLSASDGAGAHRAYNALTRRLISYMRARERASRRDR